MVGESSSPFVAEAVKGVLHNFYTTKTKRRQSGDKAETQL